MRAASRRAPRRVRRLAFVLALAACAGEPEAVPVVLHLGEDTVVLEPGARITDVHVRARRDQPEFLPAEFMAHPDDVIRFSSEDGGPHALVFDRAGTDGAGFEFVSATGQQRGLPLTEEGAAWVVLLEDAPVGRYTVRCLTHGGMVVLSVEAAAR